MAESNLSPGGITRYPDTLIPPGYIAFMRDMALGGDGNLYLTWIGSETAYQYPIHAFNPTTHAFTAVPLPGGLPFEPDTIVRSNAAGSSAVVFVTLNLNNPSVGVYDPTTGKTTLIPDYDGLAAGSHYGNGVVQTTANDWWFGADATLGPDGQTYVTPPVVGHIALAQGWGIFPQLAGTIPINGAGAAFGYLFAVLEAGGGTDTFTVTSSAPSVCTASAVNGYPGDYQVIGVAPGSCTVTTKDQTGRSVTQTFQVTTQTATISSHARRIP